MRQQLLTKHVLCSPDAGISQAHQVFKTDNRMFCSNIDLSIQSKLSLIKVHFKKYTSSEMMKVIEDGGHEL